LSVARPLRSTLEQVADALPDIVMLGIGLLIFGVFIKPIMSFVGSIQGIIGGASSAVPATLTTTGTVGSVHTTGMNRYSWYYAQGKAYTPINQFFRQMVREGQLG